MTAREAGIDVRGAFSFAVVGVCSTALYFILAMTGTAFGFPAYASSFAAHATSTVVSFFGHSILTFRSRAPFAETAPRFAVVAAMQHVIALALPALLTDYAGLPAVIAYSCVCILVPLTSYIAMSRCVFASPKA